MHADNAASESASNAPAERRTSESSLNSGDEDMCVICQAGIASRYLRTNCGHAYCPPCLQSYFDEGWTMCPLCKAEITRATMEYTHEISKMRMASNSDDDEEEAEEVEGSEEAEEEEEEEEDDEECEEGMSVAESVANEGGSLVRLSPIHHINVILYVVCRHCF